ncbi:hypothetical protein TNIN_13751 [Trichonephila inaurata madagascariensis]|uniref:Uncharacterized protein n=1 Tax=Trichonephila inaurata madagascariensis TaxID=2747483 RepID=A0A8X6XZL5_9ARAC|nr:hypothetical protein TNIN_13751 [Trichonephila inaurata madagascariensis]
MNQNDPALQGDALPQCMLFSSGAFNSRSRNGHIFVLLSTSVSCKIEVKFVSETILCHSDIQANLTLLLTNCHIVACATSSMTVIRAQLVVEESVLQVLEVPIHLAKC